MSTVMADLITSQVHSMHAITLVETEKNKKQQNNTSKTEVLGCMSYCEVQHVFSIC